MADINELDDLQFLRDIYEQARNRYRPSQLRIIILVEAPPENMERFFYYEDVKQHDALFLEVMGVLYPKQKDAYLKNGRPTDGKTDLLRRFQGDGFWLWNFYPLPASLTTEKSPTLLHQLFQKLEKYATRQTHIVLVKASIYDTCFRPLREAGYHVSPERIPYPGSGQQAVFRIGFQKALE
jgi:hypothetical protein